jgi:hypothetical protein
MRPEFLAIVDGWSLVDDFDDLTDRIERSADWAKANGPLLEDEQATVRLMIETQVAMGIRRGDFEPFIPRDTDPSDVLNWDLERKL